MSDEDLGGMAVLAAKLDASDMLGHLRNYPSDLAAAWDRAAAWDLAAVEGQKFRGVLCLGMGGSASGGDFLAALSNAEGCLPFIAWRSYGAPTWLSDEWLVLATSYSGNTEETLDAVDAALELGCSVIGLSSGGALESTMEAAAGSGASACWIPLPGGQPPRSAFGHIFGSQVALAWRLGIMSQPEDAESILEHLADAVEACDFTVEDSEDCVVTEMAESLAGSEVSVLAADSISPIAYRCACQLNENGGVFARPQVVPEMNHNEVVAWTDEGNATQALILFTWDGVHERVDKRIEWFTNSIEADPVWGIVCEGDCLLEAMLYSVVIMDWLSCAVALLRGKDPTSIGPINDLKSHLAD